MYVYIYIHVPTWQDEICVIYTYIYIYVLTYFFERVFNSITFERNRYYYYFFNIH